MLRPWEQTDQRAESCLLLVPALVPASARGRKGVVPRSRDAAAGWGQGASVSMQWIAEWHACRHPIISSSSERRSTHASCVCQSPTAYGEEEGEGRYGRGAYGACSADNNTPIRDKLKQAGSACVNNTYSPTPTFHTHTEQQTLKQT